MKYAVGHKTKTAKFSGVIVKRTSGGQYRYLLLAQFKNKKIPSQHVCLTEDSAIKMYLSLKRAVNKRFGIK